MESEMMKRLRPWMDIIRVNRLASNGIEIEYTPLTIVNGEIKVIINEQDI